MLDEMWKNKGKWYFDSDTGDCFRYTEQGVLVDKEGQHVNPATMVGKSMTTGKLARIFKEFMEAFSIKSIEIQREPYAPCMSRIPCDPSPLTTFKFKLSIGELTFDIMESAYAKELEQVCYDVFADSKGD